MTYGANMLSIPRASVQKFEFPMYPPQPIGNVVTNLDAMGLQLLQVRPRLFA